MFMNNRAAEALAREAFDEAYWWAREGVIADPSFVGVLNTLGVVYQRSWPSRGCRTRVHRVAAAPARTRRKRLHNLAQLLQSQGRDAEAKPYAQRGWLRWSPSRRTTGSCKASWRCAAAMHRPRATSSRREVARADYSSEFHYWLALAQYQLGDLDAAQRNLQKAEVLSVSRNERDLYAAKLAWLNQRRH